MILETLVSAFLLFKVSEKISITARPLNTAWYVNFTFHKISCTRNVAVRSKIDEDKYVPAFPRPGSFMPRMFTL